MYVVKDRFINVKTICDKSFFIFSGRHFAPSISLTVPTRLWLFLPVEEYQSPFKHFTGAKIRDYFSK